MPAKDGSIGGDLVRMLDYDEPVSNELVAVHPFTVVEDQHERRLDVVLFINDLPLAVIELKNINPRIGHTRLPSNSLS